MRQSNVFGWIFLLFVVICWAELGYLTGLAIINTKTSFFLRLLFDSLFWFAYRVHLACAGVVFHFHVGFEGSFLRAFFWGVMTVLCGCWFSRAAHCLANWFVGFSLMIILLMIFSCKFRIARDVWHCEYGKRDADGFWLWRLYFADYTFYLCLGTCV